MKKVLITGAGTGFGHEVAMRLALKGFEVIAAVEINAQVQTLRREATARGVTLRVEKLDVTNEGTRPASLQKSYEMKPETPVTSPASLSVEARFG